MEQHLLPGELQVLEAKYEAVRMACYGKSMTKDEVKQILATMHLPFSVHYLSGYTKFGMLGVCRGVYVFPEEPVDKQKIYDCFQLVRTRMAEYKEHKEMRQRGEMPYPDRIPAITTELNEESCIIFLKERGYVIFKPC